MIILKTCAILNHLLPFPQVRKQCSEEKINFSEIAVKIISQKHGS